MAEKKFELLTEEQKLKRINDARRARGIAGYEALARVFNMDSKKRLWSLLSGKSGLSQTTRRKPRRSIEKQILLLKTRFPKEIKRAEVKWEKLTKSQKLERISDAKRAKEYASYEVITRLFNMGCKTTVMSYLKEQIDFHRIGSHGRTPRMNSESQELFIKSINIDVARGSQHIKKSELRGKLGECAEMLGFPVEKSTPTGNSVISRLQEKNPTLKVKFSSPRVKNKAKAAASNPETVKAMFTFLADFAVKNTWKLPGCGIQEAAIPSFAIAAWDEIQMCSEDGKFRITSCGRTLTEIRSSGLHTFKLTLMLGVLLNGIALPPFGIFDGTSWSTFSGRLRAVPSDWSFWFSPSGSMFKSTGDNDNFTAGTMLKFADHIIHMRDDMQTPIDSSLKS